MKSTITFWIILSLLTVKRPYISTLKNTSGSKSHSGER
ncbi:hypothetical protein GLYMA_17G029350v4 [Glycine max]|nr:hypothetical protein GLYMA_17G029350v4 [Glycine max]